MQEEFPQGRSIGVLTPDTIDGFDARENIRGPVFVDSNIHALILQAGDLEFRGEEVDVDDCGPGERFQVFTLEQELGGVKPAVDAGEDGGIFFGQG